MLYILLLLGIILFIVGICANEEVSLGVETGISICILCITLITAGVYNYNKSTIDSRLSVLEEQNTIVLSQIEPLVQKALEYESNTYKDFKLDVAKVIAFT